MFLGAKGLGSEIEKFNRLRRIINRNYFNDDALRISAVPNFSDSFSFIAIDLFFSPIAISKSPYIAI